MQQASLDYDTQYAAGPEQDRPVDLVHLDHQTLGDSELAREVLNLFRKQSAIYLMRLRAAQDEKSWREAAHTLKGSARGIGAWPVACAADAVEQLKQALPARHNAEAVEKLARSIEQANAYIGELLSQA